MQLSGAALKQMAQVSPFTHFCGVFRDEPGA
jgi:hypothetical protein